jgi:hypothetical protein
MAKSITHISIFLASPSDLAEERLVVKQVVDELNSMIRQPMGIYLDLLAWEKYAYPSAGIDAQDVINSQLGNEYDIFIGMMWQRFGSPTGRAGSGTEEEFERAYSKYKQTKGSTKIMLYFSAKPIQPDAVDFEQLGKVRQFKSRAQDMGILHWAFNDAESFQKMLKIHLMKQVSDVNNDLLNSIGRGVEDENGSIENSNDGIIEETEDEDENGYFDLMEIFTENFAQVEKVLAAITEHIQDLGVQLNRKSAKIDAINKSPNNLAHSLRALIDSSAADINNYVNLTAIELPRFRDLFMTGIDAFSNGLTISEANGNKMDVGELETLMESIAYAKNNLAYATKSLVGFRDTASNVPSISKSINRATRLLRNTLDSLINELNSSDALLDGLNEVVYSILLRTKDGDSGAMEI